LASGEFHEAAALRRGKAFNMALHTVQNFIGSGIGNTAQVAQDIQLLQ